ncbi:MAG: PAS domain S-box protein [Chlamydiae bacterium]|nr:PAS domain S-box protein [Chlamydiota bacterium]
MPIRISFLKTLAIICASIVTLAGFFFTLCWHFGYILLLTFPPSTWPIPYQAALSLLLAGISFFFLIFPVRFPITRILGAALFLNGIMRTIEIIGNVDLGITKYLLGPHSPTSAVFPVVLIGAINFAFIGLLLLTWQKSKSTVIHSNFSIFISLLIVFTSLLGVLSYILPLELSFGWKETIPINFYTALPLIFFGVGTASLRYYTDLTAKVNISKGFPFIATLAFFFFNSFLVMGLKGEKEHVMSRFIQDKANASQTSIQNTYKNDFGFLFRQNDWMEERKIVPDAAWEADASLIARDNDEIDSFYWTTPQLLIKKVFPPLSDHVINPSILLKDEQSQMLTAIQADKPYLAYIEKNNIFLLCFPTCWDNTLQGILIIAIDCEKFFSKAMEKQLRNNYELNITSSNNTLIYSSSKEEGPDNAQWKASLPLSLNNLELHLTIRPTETFLHETLSSFFLLLMYTGGVFISLSLGILIYLKQAAQRKSEELEVTQKKLEKTLSDLNYTLTSTTIGTWEWVPQADTLSCDPVTYKLLGVAEGQVNTLQEFIEHVYPTDREKVKKKLIETSEKESALKETIRIIWPDGNIRYITLKGHTLKDVDNNLTKVVGIWWDDTAIFSSQLMIRLSAEISRIFSESSSFFEAATKILPLIKRAFGWDVIVLWKISDQGDDLSCLNFVHDLQIQLPTFEKALFALDQSPLQGTLKEIYTTHKPVWFTDFSKEATDSRTEAALKDGIKGSIAFPIFEHNKLMGVLELFKKDLSICQMNEEIQSVIVTISLELGQFLRKKMVEHLNAELAEIVTYSNDAIYTISPEGIILNWNRGAENIYGWKAVEIVGKQVTELIPKDCLSEYTTNMEILKKGNPIERFETKRLHKNGSLIWVSNTYSPILSNRNKHNRISVISLDISQFKLSELALAKSEKKFHWFVETIQSWIWQIDANCLFLYSNPSVGKILGYTPEELQGNSILNFIADIDQKKAKKELEDSFIKKQGWEIRTLAWKHKNGSIRYLESSAKPIIDEKGAFVGFMGADRDVTERMNLEKTKNEFISVASHEIRTPLTSIYGALGLLNADKTLPEKTKELLTIAYRNSARLARLVSDILDYEKLQNLDVEKLMQKVDLAQLLQQSIELSLPLLLESHIKIVKESFLPEIFVQAVPDQLLQVMFNLFSNAIKFSPPGSTTYVSMKLTGNMVRVSVRDEGIGIPLEFQSKIFTRFAQVDTSDTRNAQGTGLGLSICKSIIEKFGGKIGFESKIHEGSTFYFDLPIQ